MEKQKGLAIITGASQGIGAVIAAGLAKDGYRVVLIARNRQNLEKVHDEIMLSDKNVQEPIVLPLDITDCTKVDTEIKNIHQKYGTVDILVNAAAMFMDGSLSESVDNFRKIMEINVIAQYGILKTVTEIMKAQKDGYIFNIASRAAKYGFADGGIYGSTKFAFLGLAESLYRELAPLGIRVTTLCPGWVNTEMAKKAGTPFKDEEMVQPDDLLNTIRYLLNLSEYVCIKDIVFEMNKSIIYIFGINAIFIIKRKLQQNLCFIDSIGASILCHYYSSNNLLIQLEPIQSEMPQPQIIGINIFESTFFV